MEAENKLHSQTNFKETFTCVAPYGTTSLTEKFNKECAISHNVLRIYSSSYYLVLGVREENQ